LKVLFADGSGMCVFYKRLDRGTFRVPEARDAESKSVTLSERELDDLLDGIDVEPVAKPARAKREPRLH
jgi:transposase